eukprot:1336971-Pyramimonas_sp.AAC.1
MALQSPFPTPGAPQQPLKHLACRVSDTLTRACRNGLFATPAATWLYTVGGSSVIFKLHPWHCRAISTYMGYSRCAWWASAKQLDVEGGMEMSRTN